MNCGGPNGVCSGAKRTGKGLGGNNIAADLGQKAHQVMNAIQDALEGKKLGMQAVMALAGTGLLFAHDTPLGGPLAAIALVTYFADGTLDIVSIENGKRLDEAYTSYKKMRDYRGVDDIQPESNRLKKELAELLPEGMDRETFADTFPNGKRAWVRGKRQYRNFFNKAYYQHGKSFQGDDRDVMIARGIPEYAFDSDSRYLLVEELRGPDLSETIPLYALHSDAIVEVVEDENGATYLQFGTDGQPKYALNSVEARYATIRIGKTEEGREEIQEITFGPPCRPTEVQGIPRSMMTAKEAIKHFGTRAIVKVNDQRTEMLAKIEEECDAPLVYSY